MLKIPTYMCNILVCTLLHTKFIKKKNILYDENILPPTQLFNTYLWLAALNVPPFWIIGYNFKYYKYLTFTFFITKTILCGNISWNKLKTLEILTVFYIKPYSKLQRILILKNRITNLNYQVNLLGNFQ